MTALLVTVVASGAEVDRVTLDDEERLAYRTGAARDIFEGRRRVMGDGKASDADLLASLDGWSNGYITVRAAGKDTDQPKG